MATFGHRKHSRDFSITISAGRLPMGIRERIIAVAITLPLWVLLLIAAPTLVAAQGDMARMKSDYRRPAPFAVESQVLVDLGRDLFFDPQISASGKTACASCHFPELGWTVTDARSRNDSGKLTSRKSQPLVGIGHAGDAPVGWDGRNASLEAQAKSSIATGSMSMRETETPVKVEVIEERIRAVPEYAVRFKAAMPNSAINLDSIVKAIAAYERTIEPGIAPFDRWIEGDES